MIELDWPENKSLVEINNFTRIAEAEGSEFLVAPMIRLELTQAGKSFLKTCCWSEAKNLYEDNHYWMHTCTTWYNSIFSYWSLYSRPKDPKIKPGLLEISLSQEDIDNIVRWIGLPKTFILDLGINGKFRFNDVNDIKPLNFVTPPPVYKLPESRYLELSVMLLPKM